jgi:hypothetical protein
MAVRIGGLASARACMRLHRHERWTRLAGSVHAAKNLLRDNHEAAEHQPATGAMPATGAGIPAGVSAALPEPWRLRFDLLIVPR